MVCPKPRLPEICGTAGKATLYEAKKNDYYTQIMPHYNKTRANAKAATRKRKQRSKGPKNSEKVRIT